MKVPLSSLPADRPEKRTRARFAVELSDERSGQVLVITSDETLAGYQLDQRAAGWGEGVKHPDGVVLGTSRGRSYVCFIELKSSMKLRERGQGDPAAHALEQLAGAFRYFHPFGASSTGDEHHDQWRSRTDALSYSPAAEHEVIGIVVGYRQVPRPPPTAPILALGQKRAVRVVVPVHGAQANRSEIAFPELLARAGIR
ncbi:MAG: hypothetical protein IT372_03985 [Polyangiaceae bacterium]|nr:hypothetical protein [Polyangiaceae bacterium]